MIMRSHTLLTAPVAALFAAALALGLPAVGQAEAVEGQEGQRITVYKSPTCGCCQGWIDYLGSHGFAVETHDLADLSAIKAQHGLGDPRLRSCHTAIVDGYVVEGQVPVDDIRRLLATAPPVLGITAPGMPQLSPGMLSTEPKDYDVLTFDAEGRTELFSRY
jgi:hypothetical protein